MKEGDSDTWFCYHSLLKLHIRPKDYIEMDIYEKAIVQQFIIEYKKSKEEEEKDIARARKRKR